ncbi:MAG: DUF2938 domain-containing protein [Proteobacteria bacterium]|uniref:DUF2938 domain-containing protein n=1 Tax=Acinetobacter venetianus TaxID=52133 RepID=UPI00036B763E|nr:DUF2938 domain-containing protein [Acinetobacter venetianus]MCR4531854.1 DUF2938 domain-containing protein [Acinetobacter venetianus]MDA0696991.1 DUF2938 domain-containing protein [Pseudomonadota bacterium]MDA1254596.1 DUF2938 domain-containing protein [Pseudomonadota bacterium]
MNFFEQLFQILVLGIGATIVMDIWLFILMQLNIPTLNFALLGRWIGWIFKGKIRHHPISQSSQIQHESLVGWCTHYSVGVLFAFIFILFVGETWLIQPQFYSAFAFGLITVLVPFLIMQPAMGAGIAATNTPQPWLNRLKSLINHGIFGCGLYLAAKFLKLFN